MPKTAKEKKKKVPNIDIFVGCDTQGDACLYVRKMAKNGAVLRYYTGEELDEIAEELEPVVAQLLAK